MLDSIWLWLGFNGFVLAMLALDLGVLRRKAHEVSLREAAAWSAVWIVLALSFAYGVHHSAGQQAGLEFLTGYLIEKALSVDNIFVFVLILSYFRVPAKHHHRVLFWGVIGALLTRGCMILLGSVLVSRFHWILYVFGALLLLTAFRMITTPASDTAVHDNALMRLFRRAVRMTPDYHGQHFFVRLPSPTGPRWYATPLLIVLITVETTDVIFAVDSIPAIFAVTQDPFIIYTSNVFAILGLRSLYFVLAGVLHRFQYLKAGIALVLVFVGLKMLTEELYAVPIGVSLAVVATILAASIVVSVALVAARERRARRARRAERTRDRWIAILVPFIALGAGPVALDPVGTPVPHTTASLHARDVADAEVPLPGTGVQAVVGMTEELAPAARAHFVPRRLQVGPASACAVVARSLHTLTTPEPRQHLIRAGLLAARLGTPPPSLPV